MSHTFKKQFGQNFLRGQRFAKAMIAGLALEPGDVVIEVGPGEGMVTSLLLEQVSKVIAVEIDYELVPKLIAKFQETGKFKLVHQDILEFQPAEYLEGHEYKFIGSLPYNISKPIIRKFLTANQPPKRMSVIVQAEVGHDYTAGAPKASFLANWARLYADVKKLESIPASQFFPRPKVDGAIITFTPHNRIDQETRQELEKLLRAAFSSPRKTLWNNLNSSRIWVKESLQSVWEALSLSPTLRPAEVEFDTWIQIYDHIVKAPSSTLGTTAQTE